MQSKEGNIMPSSYIRDFFILLTSVFITISLTTKWKIGEFNPYISATIFLAILYFVIFVVHLGSQYFFTVQNDSNNQSDSNNRLGKKKIIIVLFVLPAVISIMVNLVTISGLSVVEHIENYFSGGDRTLIAKIENIVIETEDYDVKVAGVQSLAAIGTIRSLNSLINIAKKNDKKFKDSNNVGGFYCELAQAIAAHERKAKEPLLELFDWYNSNDNSSLNPTDYHERFFQRRFEKIRNETSVVKNTIVRKNIEVQLQQIEVNLIRDLKKVEEEMPASDQYRVNITDLVLDSYRNMKEVKADKKIYHLAESILRNDKFSVETRKRAVSLFVLHGSIKDIDLILTYIDNITDNAFKERSLQVINGLIHNSNPLKDSKRLEDLADIKRSKSSSKECD